MKKTVMTFCAALLTIGSVSATTLRDYAPGQLPATKNVKFAMSKDGVLSMEFGEGNLKGSRAWMRRYNPMLKPGQKLRITMQVKTTDMMDPRAKVGYLVQTLGENNKYLLHGAFAPKKGILHHEAWYCGFAERRQEYPV